MSKSVLVIMVSNYIQKIDSALTSSTIPGHSGPESNCHEGDLKLESHHSSQFGVILKTTARRDLTVQQGMQSAYSSSCRQLKLIQLRYHIQ